MKTATERLVRHITTCPIISQHHSLSVTDENVKCKNCDGVKSFSRKDTNFVRNFLSHCSHNSHRAKCGWVLKRDYRSGRGFKTVREVNEAHQITRFLQSSRYMTADIHQEDEPRTENELDTSPTVSNPINAMPDSPTTMPDSPTTIPDSPTTNTHDCTAVMDNEAQTEPLVKVDKGSCCSGRSMEELLSPTFQEDLKAFFQSMQFKLKPNFSTNDVRRYFDAHPTAREFTENGFSRDVSQSRHSIPVKDHVVGQALKHDTPSAVEWSQAFGGPSYKTVTNACKAKVEIIPFLNDKNLDDHFGIFVDKILVMRLGIAKSSIGNVPMQVSLDATATTGRLHTRKSREEGKRTFYGVADPMPSKRTLLSVDEREDNVKLKNTRQELCVYGIENVLELEKDGLLTRASSYMSVIILPLIPGARPYCIGMYSITKGSDSDSLNIAHNMINSAAKRAGLRIVTLPGDGDTTLRHLQWSTYICDRGWRWLKEQLLLPCYLFFDTNGDFFRFPLQDMLHNIKKGRNSAKLLETHCMTLGPVHVDPLKEKRTVIRWDLLYDFFTKYPEYMRFSSLSALNLTDKQDPSLVTSISCLHNIFTYYGYEAMGMYFKALHYMCDAFLDKKLNPYDRLYKIWWCKTFFATWEANKEDPTQFMSVSAFRDIVCGCDGLVLYLETVRRKFPNAEIATYHLGSDANEQLFAFIRVSYSNGRARNLDALKMAYGMERRNVRSELSLPMDSSVVAHTRGNTVLSPTVEIIDSSTDTDNCSTTVTQKVWKGSDLNLNDMVKNMNQATKDCISEGRKRKFSVFLKEEDPDVRIGKERVPPCLYSPSLDALLEEDDAIDDDGYQDEEDMEPLRLQFEDDEGPHILNTKLYGKMDFRSAETLLLNGGRSSISAKSRQAKFTGDVFGMNTDIRLYNQPFCGCTEALKLGDRRSFPSFADENVLVRGEVRYISYKQCPLKFYCKTHSLIKGTPNLWLYISNRKYKRCKYV